MPCFNSCILISYISNLIYNIFNNTFLNSEYGIKMQSIKVSIYIEQGLSFFIPFFIITIRFFLSYAQRRIGCIYILRHIYHYVFLSMGCILDIRTYHK